MTLTPDERRARNARRMRDVRARERAQRAAAKEAQAQRGTSPGGDAPSPMLDAVNDAMSHMKWIQPSDAASVAQARLLAADVDRFHEAGDDQKMLSAHGRLSRVLSDLGGTPSMRLARELRSLRNAQIPEGDDGGTESSEGPQPGNVSQFKRPPKRRA